MLSEARKREKVANAVLGLAFATSAAQSPKDFVKTGHIESPGVAIMQRTIGNPRRQRKDLDNPRVVSRGTKTFKEFVEKCYELEESSTGERSGRRTRGKVTLAPGRGADMTPKERSTAAIAKKAGLKGTGKYSTKDLRTRRKEYRTDGDASVYGDPKSTKQDTTITTHSSPRSAAAGERIITKTEYVPGKFQTKHVSSADSIRRAKDFRKSLTTVGANKRGRVHSVDIIQRGNYDKNDPRKQIERGKNLIKAVKDVPKHLKKSGAKKGEAVIGEPAATMPDENKNVGAKKREKIYKNIFKNRISKASPKTGRMVGKV